jgi:hypothetical protein
MSILSNVKEVFVDSFRTMFFLIKIMIPVSIIVKILEYYGLIKVIGEILSPIMGLVGLPGEFGLVWATTLISNIYGGLIVFFNLSLINTYTIAQVTVLASMMLIAHTLPVEVRISQKAGVRGYFTILFRLISAFFLGISLSVIFTYFNILDENASVVWQPNQIDPNLLSWLINEIRNYIMIFLIILSLLFLLKFLKITGLINKLNKSLEPFLRLLGMSKHTAPISIIGMTLGIAYGGGLIINEAKSESISKKDIFLSFSLMGLSHSLIEDTLLMVAIGASLIGILFGRIFFTVFILIILVKLINRIPKKTFIRFFMK